MSAASTDENVSRMLMHLDAEWRDRLSEALSDKSFRRLADFVAKERIEREGQIYPGKSDVFAALNLVPFSKVRVVLLGQDPYHGPGQAHGLSFSVPTGIPHPPSLRNIFKELHTDLGALPPVSGDLTSWARQGVLLLNTVLTVRDKQANSHRRMGWESLTDAVVRLLDRRESSIVFLLWGNPARAKKSLIQSEHHVVFESAHPSPLSAHRGFFGSRPFSRANEALENLGYAKVDWSLSVP